MHKRSISIFGVFIILLALAACSNKKVSNPIVAVDSKQPDKILFDRAMDAMKHNRFDVARLTLQTLINTYPDSEFVARAKLAVGDSWYAEGGTAAMAQAENEYKDFETFFPNMPEAAEAQLKIANIHYREMEKPDRDFTHALRAQEEYRNLISQYPDSKLVPEAKLRLLQVQEVLAEREYRVGRFYYMRESWNAAVARLQTLADTYPLYSKADETLYLLGTCYQRQADNFRASNLREAIKARMVKEREDLAAAAYSRIVTKYPAMARAADARKMLAEMHYPVPTPTPAEIAASKALEASRGELGYKDTVMDYLHRGPDQAIVAAPKAGEPVMVDPKPTNAPDLAAQVNQEMVRIAEGKPGAGGGGEGVSVEQVKGPIPNDAPPRSDDANTQPADNNEIPVLKPITDSSASDSTQTATPPVQVNQLENAAGTTAAGSSSTATGATAGSSAPNAQAAQATPADQTDYSTNKPKKKKGLRKLNPF
jgi:outer membrane protein assembly factor BamD